MSNIYGRLFTLISLDKSNEDEISAMLDACSQVMKPHDISSMINTPNLCCTGAETMIMWAVWRLKKTIVQKLIALGADVKYVNEMGNSVSTYWDTTAIKKNETLACEIATNLYRAGANLLRADGYSWCIVQKAREDGFVKLQKTIEELDPVYKTFEFLDEDV